MSLERTVAEWLAREAKLDDPSLISNVVFEASEGRAWSEITIENFSCFVRFDYGDESKSIYMDESDAVRFLNEVWKAPNTEREPE